MGRIFVGAVGLSTVLYGLPCRPITFAEAAGNYATVILQDAPAAYWRLGEASGLTTAADASGHSITLTYQGAVGLGAPGAVSGDANTAAQFNGTTTYASRTTAPLSATANWSLEAWIYPTTLPQLGVAIYNGVDDSTHAGYGFEIATSAGASGSNIIGILGSAGRVDSGYTLPAANRWYHVVMTRDATTIRFYVNGQQTATTSPTAPGTPGAAASVGGGVTGTSALTAPFAGIIDEAAMYASALSQGRIVAHYQEGANVQTAFGKWNQQSPATVPAARSDASIAYDATRNKVVMFGGKNASGTALSETWTYDGTNWTKLTLSPSPSARSGAALAYDAATATVVLFGGYTGSKYLNDTWSWNGTAWSQLTPGTSPGIRAFTSVAYDAPRSTVLLFGGQTSANPTVLNETWTWNGTTWSKKTPATSPSVRYLASAAYDSATSNVVLFGGYSGSAYLADTWSWNGTTWTQSTGAPAPSIRRAAALAFDVATNQLTLLGGYNGTAYLNDTWAWDGSAWSAQLTATSPPIRAAAAAAYQNAIGSIVLYGGTAASALSDTWAWTTPPSPALNVQATRGNGQATVNWTVPSSTGGSAITGYRVTPYSGSSASSPTTVTATTVTITGLTNGTTYTFQVVPANAIGNGPGANSNSVTPATVPGAPSPATGTAGDTQATVNWTVPSDGGSAIMNYTVTPYIGSTAGTPVNVTAPASSKIVTGLINGTVYTFQVTATNSVGTGAVATTGQIKPGRVPGAPTGVTASPGDGLATVSWTAPATDGGYPITGYTVTSSPGGLIGSSNGSQTTASVTGLTDGTPYTFTVTAANSMGTGPSSTASSPVTPIGRPGAPTGVTASAGNASALVTWNPPAANGSPITSYTVTPYINGTAQSPTAVNGSPPAASVTIANLTNGTPYSFQVTATNNVGTGPAGSTVGTVTPATAPSPPTTVSATAGNATATVTWQPPTSDGGSALTGYTITPFAAGTPGTAQTVNATTLTATFNGLSNGTSYVFKVVATNAVGSSNQASSNAVTPASAPGPPTSVQATPGDAHADVTWLAPTSDGGAPITVYTVTAYSGGTAQASVTVNAPTTSATINGLTNGTPYTFQVTATNSAGTSVAGVSAVATPMRTPDAPSSVTATAADASATVTWTAVPPSGNGGSAITGYTVTPYVAGTAGTPQSVDASTLTASFNGLSNGTTYIFKVVATNAMGNSATPTSSNAVTPAAPPGQPQSVTASAGSTQATVNWQAPTSDGGASITSYTVTPYIGNAAQPGWTVNPTPTTFVATGLTNGTTYTFQVAAINSVGTSPVGTSNAVTPATTPSAPQNVTAVTGNQLATVSWSAPANSGGSDVTSYTITAYQGSTQVGNPVTTNGPSPTSRDMTGLTNGQSYTFKVYASNSVGPGPTASSNSVVVGQPQAPTGVTVTAGANQATISWTGSVTNGATMTAYVVQASIGATAVNATATGGASTSVVMPGLQGGVAYTFQVYGESNDGNTAFSAASAPVTPTGAATTYASTVIGDNPTFYYRLGEPSGGAAADSSGNGHAADYLFTPGLGAAGALVNDGDSGIAVAYGGGFIPGAGGVVRYHTGTAGLPVGNAPRTIELWMKSTMPNSVLNGLVGYGTDATRQAFQIQTTNDNQLTLYVNGNDRTFNTPYRLNNGGWHQVVVTYDGTTATMYLDGLSLGGQSFGAALNTAVDGNGLILANDFWNYGGGVSYQFNGSLDEVALYPAALTAAQVAAHFSASGNAKPSAPTAVTATAGANQATIAWTAPSVGAPISQYVVEAFNAGAAVNAVGVNGATTTTTVSGLQGGIPYTFQVIAENNFGFSAPGTSTAVTPAGGSSTYASTVIADNPTYYYRLGEASGPVAADSSGHGRNAEYLYAPTFSTTGALQGDSDTGIAVAYGGGFVPGAGGVVRYRWDTTGLPTGNAARSVELWFKTTMPNSQLAGLVGYGSNSTRQAFQVQTTADTQLTLYTNGDDHAFTTPYAINNGAWHQVIVTYDGSTATMYLDGQSLGGQTFGGALNTAVDGNGLILANDFYNYGGGVNYQFAGSLDDVSLYPTALTASQVQAHFLASGNGRPQAPVVSTTVGQNQATVSWTVPSTTPGAPVTAYLVTTYLGSQAQNAIATNGSTTSAVVSGLKQGATYTFQVTAQNNFGYGLPGTSAATQITGGAPTTYASTVVGDSPSFYYRLSEPSGTIAADSSGHGRNADYLYAPGFGTSGALLGDSDPGISVAYGGGFIPGAGGVVRYRWGTAGLPTGNAARSVEFWMKTTMPNSVLNGLVGYGSNATRQAFQIQTTNDNQLTLYVNGDNRSYPTPYRLNNGGWHQVVLTYDGTTATMYLDGQSLGGQTFGASLNTVIDGNGLILANDFYNYGGGVDYQFNGSLDDVALYPAALTPAQVSAHFSASGNSRPGTPTNVTAAGAANQATVTWTGVPGNGSTTYAYMVTAFNGSQPQYQRTVDGTQTSATITGLPANTAFTFQVTATNNFGTSAAGVSAAVTPTGAASTYPSTVVGDGPTYYYRLDEASGSTVADSSGNGRNAEYLYAPTFGASGAVVGDGDTGVSMTYNGAFVPGAGGIARYRWSTAGLPTGNASRSIEAWFNTTSGNSGGLVGYGTNSTRQAFQLQIRGDNQLALVTSGDDKVFDTPYPIDTGGWHQAIVTYDGTTATTYLDGLSLGAQTFGGSLNTAVDGNGLILANDFWNYGGGVGYQFSGSLDEVSIYPIALSAAQVQAHFAASGNTRPTAPSITSVTASANAATIDWTAAQASSGSPVTSYRVTAYAGSAARNSIAVDGHTTSTTLSGLAGTTAYTFQVVATNTFGDGPASAASGAVTTGGPAATYASTVIGDNPTTYLRLGDPSGSTAADSSGHGNIGQYSGNPYTLGSAGSVPNDSDTSAAFANGCCYFGQPIPGGYLRVRPVTDLPLGNSSRSVEAWIKTTLNGTQAIAGYGLSGSTRQAFQERIVGTNQIQIVSGNDDHTITAPPGVVLNDGNWHQLVVTYDGTTLTAYVDGVSIGSTAFSGALNTALDNNGLVLANDFWWFGTQQSNSQLNGSIDEVAVYGAALTAAQVSNHYQAAGYSFGVPGAPTAVTATAGSNQATVTWTAPANTGTSSISGYTVTPHVGSTVRTPVQVAGTQTSVVIANLSGGTTYTFTLVATNGSGNGSTSAASSAVTVTGAVYAYSSTVLGDGPGAYWRLGESPGVPAIDATGNGNNGSYTGGFTEGQVGPVVGDPNTSTGFDGSAGHVVVPSSASLDIIGALSIEAWVKFSAAGTTQLFVNKGDGASTAASAYELGFVPGTGFVFDTFRGGSMARAASANGPTVGQWYHLVGTRTVNGTLLLYVNGQVVGSANDGGAPLNNINAALGLAGSGLGTGANLQPFSGTLGEVAVYPAALSGVQVANHWQLGGYRAGTPTGVAGTGGANQAAVSWTAPSGGPAITGYLVTPQVGTTPRTPTYVGAGVTSTTITNLSAASYTFTVAAMNAYGLGAASTASTAVTVSGTTYPYAGTVLGNSPAGYWRMGEGSGTLAVDASGHGNAGTFSGGTTLGQAGAIQGDPDKGPSLDGASGHVIVPSSATLSITGALSVETWVKLNSVAATQLLVNKGDGATAIQSAYQLAYVAGQGFSFSTFIGNVTNAARQSSTPATAGTWYHVVGTRTAAGALILYVNGNSAGTASDGGAALNVVDSAVGIGASGSGTGSTLQPVNGSVDEAAVYPTVLSQPQVAARWDSGGFVPTAPQSVTARIDANNQATVSWLPPANAGTSTISSYSVTTVLGSNTYPPLTVDGGSWSANVPNLAAGLTYTFSVAAVNGSGAGPSASSGPVVPTGPVVPDLGQHFEILAQNTSLPFGFFAAAGGWRDLSAQWTIEGWMWGFSSNADTGGNSAWGLLSGTHWQGNDGQTPLGPSPAAPVAGINMATGGPPLTSSFVWPGGSYPIPSTGYGYPDAVTPTHYALDYDGSTVRGFINGNLLFAQAASGLGGLPGFPGIADQQNMQTGNFDEFRISSVARYTTSFTPPTTAFPNDNATDLLWHFDGFGAQQLFFQNIYTYTNYSASSSRPSALGGPLEFGDSSGNGADGGFFWSGSPQITGGFPMAYAVFELPQNQSVTAADIRSPSEAGFTCNWGQYPVNCETGEFFHTFSDLAIPGRGVPLSFQRTYSSLHASTSGTLGHGWTDAYNMSLSIAPASGNVTVNEEAWTSVTFTQGPPNTFQAPTRVFATLIKNGDGTYTFTRKNQTHYVFDATGKLIKEIDRNGYATLFGYNGSGQLATVTDAANRALTLGYTNGMLTSVSDQTGRSVSFQYDGSGNLTQATDVGGGISKFTYDGNHFMLSMKDAKCTATPSCNGVVNTFDGGGRVQTQTDPMNRQTTFSYRGSTTAIYDPRGTETDETYMAGLLMVRTVGANTTQPATWLYSYDPNTLAVQSIKDPNGRVTSISYDAVGNPLNIVDPLGRTRRTTYDSLNDPLTVTDPLGVQTTYAYDPSGNVSSVSTPLAGTGQRATIGFTYDPSHPGDVLTMTDENSKDWTFSYDQYGNRTSVADPLTHTTTSAYDTVGRVTSSVSPNGNVPGGNPTLFTSSFVYNAFGEVTQATDPLTHTVSYAYDENGNLSRLTDANLNATNYAYDFDNELSTVTRPDTSQLQYSYDPSGNVTQAKDGLHNPVDFAYDALNRVTTKTDDLQRTTRYGYDISGNRTSVIDPQGRTATYGYNVDGELTSASFSDGTTPSVGLTYDADGQRLTMADGTGTTRYSYDSLHRITQSMNGANLAIGYAYDLKSHVTSITYPGGAHVVNRGYDDAGRLNSVTDWLGQGSTTFGYDANSNLLTQTSPNGVVESRSYDNADRLTAITDARAGNTFLSLGYGRDNAGQLTSENATTFGYNLLNQLSSAGPGNYSYDAADRLTQHAITGGTTTNLVYDIGNQLQSLTVLNGSTQVQKYTYGFDPNGNRTSTTDQSTAVTTYGYDQADRLTSVGSNVQYAYDGAGLRMTKTVGGSTKAFAWDQVDGLPLTILDGTTSYVTGLGGLPLEQISASGAPLYYHQDQLGSTRALTDATGAVVATYAYDAYGNITSPPANVSNPFQFAGAYADGESGLIYLRARYYDPVSGSFLTQDPLSSLQPYAYAADSPLNLVDPSGLAPSLVADIGNLIQSAPQRGFGLMNQIFFGPQQALNNGDCLGAAVGLAFFFAPEFRFGGNALRASEEIGQAQLGLASSLRGRQAQIIDEMSASGYRTSGGGLSRAGFEYQKHMNRGELPRVGRSALDAAGQNHLDEILTSPQAEWSAVTSGRFKGGTRVAVPNGPGAVFDAAGNFQYFGIY